MLWWCMGFAAEVKVSTVKSSANEKQVSRDLVSTKTCHIEGLVLLAHGYRVFSRDCVAAC